MPVIKTNHNKKCLRQKLNLRHKSGGIKSLKIIRINKSNK